MNRLNRNLESIITVRRHTLVDAIISGKGGLLHFNEQVGNEFGSVEALWSQFEGVMGKHADNGENNGGAEAGEGDTTVHNEEDHRVTTSTVPLAGGDDNDQVKQEPDDEQ